MATVQEAEGAPSPSHTCHSIWNSLRLRCRLILVCIPNFKCMMATDDRETEGAPSPAHNESVHVALAQKDVSQQSQPNIHVDQNGNPVTASTAIQAQLQPIIKYIDQNGNPVAPPLDGTQIIKYIDQNGNSVAPPTNAEALSQQSSQQPHRIAVIQRQQSVEELPADTDLKQQYGQRGGNCLKITLTILWSIASWGGIPQFIMGVWSIDQGCEAACTLSMLLPGLVATIGGAISVYGVNSYNYSLSMLSSIASGILLVFGILLLMVEDGLFWFLIAYSAPLAIYLCIFASSLMFINYLLISYATTDGHPDPNACGCCVPPPNQPIVYHQPGVALEIGDAAQPAEEGASTGAQQSEVSAQVDVYEENVNGIDHMDVVSKAMMTNGGYCWKVTLIALWSFVLINSIPQFLVGCIFVYMFSEVESEFLPVWIWSLLIPGLIALIAAPISIHGVSKYSYRLNVFSCVALGLLLLDGVILFTVEWGPEFFVMIYMYLFILYSCMLGFSIKFGGKIGYIQQNGHADDVNSDCCKGVYDCCQCQRKCRSCQ